MNDETSNKDEKAPEQGAGEPLAASGRRRRWVPEPVARAGFAFQERLVWPLQDRFTHLGSGPSRTLVLGGGALALAAVIAVVVALSGGGGSTPTTAVTAPAANEPLATTSTPPAKESEPKPEPPRETLHGAAPVFSPPSPASKGGEKTGTSKSAAAGAASSEGSAAKEESAGAGASESSTSPSPGSATISSDPKNAEGGKAADNASDGETPATAARAAVPDGPPAGPAALKVAREFAKGFVVYETGGEKTTFQAAFAASATPELTKALLRRPPKQPAGVKVPRAKVLNVVAGPSRGQVYEVSVALLRVGVTSELRLEMERTKTAGEKGKRVEWRVTNVLG